MAAESAGAPDQAQLEQFLRELPRTAPGAARTPLPAVAAAAPQVFRGQDLPERFTRAATSAGMCVHRTSPAGWLASVRDVLRACRARTVFVAAQPDSALAESRARELAAALAAEGVEVQSTPADAVLFSADAAVTGVAAAIAETGTLVCDSGPGLARGASLIPPVHIALVAERQLLPDLYDYFDGLTRGALPANANLITGPSKTADIEGILITGVHGPGEVHIVLITS